MTDLRDDRKRVVPEEQVGAGIGPLPGVGVLRRGAALGRLLSTGKARFGVGLFGVFVVVAVFAPWLSPYDPHATSFAPFKTPSWGHPFGTTAYGQDVLSQVIWGARPSLEIALLGGLAATAFALIVGVSAAYAGGLGDNFLSLFTDVFLVIPGLPLMIVITAYLPRRGTWLLIAVIVLTGWAFGARQFRAQTLSVRQRGFVEAARSRGERGPYTIVFEILPTMIPLIAASFLSAAFYSVLAAAGLQFLGLGDVTTISWGTMLYWAQNNEALASGSPLWAFVPGACIGLLGASFAFINYGFDEVANPVLRSTRKRNV
jgi:peptide/nickel transport system permease protein